jgi:hypothetical protein
MVLIVLNPLESPSSKPHNNPKGFFFFFWMGYYKWVGLLELGQITSLGWPIWVNLLYNPKLHGF